jgi:predicted acetyltransferase
VLLGLDLFDKVTGWKVLATDDPLPLMLTDSRQVQTTEVHDGMWSRVLDVPAALAARTYAAEIDVVLDVQDDFLDRGGRVRLRGGPDGATCEPTDAAVDMGIAVAALGPLLFGAGRATTLARARLAEAEPAVLQRVDAAFTTDRDPLHGTGF